MSDSKHKGPDEPSAPEPKRSGRVGFDERGNSVWEWQLETGVYSRDVSTQKLKKLELGDLSIAETAVNRRPPGLGGAPKALPGGGFNPYDNSPRAERGANPYDKTSSAANKPKATAPRSPADLKKIEEWMKLKKRVEENKDEDD